MMWQLALKCLFLIAMSLQKHFVDMAPTSSTASPQNDEFLVVEPSEVIPETLDANVRELESLKQSIGKTLEMIKTHAVQYGSYPQFKEEVKEKRNIKPKLSEYLQTKAKKTFQAAFQGEEGNMGKKLSGSQYSALDMAEYVFWTGDEKGVTRSMEEFLQAGLMTGREAILFLDEIKHNLDYLQHHYGVRTNVDASREDKTKETTKNLANHIIKSRLPSSKSIQVGNPSDYQSESEQTNQKRILLTKQNHFDTSRTEVNVEKEQVKDEIDENVLDRLRTVDFLYTEYSLEEIIYQLAKLMFTKSLSYGDSTAQQPFQKFVSFLENEAEQGHISRVLETKVLDVLMNSLVDTINEHADQTGFHQFKENQRLLSSLNEQMESQHEINQPQNRHKTKHKYLEFN